MFDVLTADGGVVEWEPTTVQPAHFNDYRLKYPKGTTNCRGGPLLLNKAVDEALTFQRRWPYQQWQRGEAQAHRETSNDKTFQIGKMT